MPAVGASTLRFTTSWSSSGSARCSVYFFFQAEDGIRDWSVTGVQTCALPILRRRRGAADHGARDGRARGADRRAGRAPAARAAGGGARRRRGARLRGAAATARPDRKSVVEGKRVDLGGRRIIKKKKETSNETP